MNHTHIQKKLVDKGMKVTPQRMAVLESLIELKNHPTADNIIDYVRKNHPNIAVGTVYNILDTFVEYELVYKVKTERDIMRYDAVEEKHHHLYCIESDRIEDYYDEELSDLIENYFARKGIRDFKIEDVKLQIIGRFLDKKPITK